MVNFNGFDKGVIGKPLPADSTLNNMKKDRLIELLHMAEENHKVLASAYANVVDISIHVPTRGTTVITISEILIPNEFQSTFPQGERRFATSGPYSFGAFQSTFPQGERQTMVLHAGKVP